MHLKIKIFKTFYSYFNLYKFVFGKSMKFVLLQEIRSKDYD